MKLVKIRKRQLTLRRLFFRALLLQCPACGKGRPFRGTVRMRHHCRTCGYVYEREAGYFLGSIFLNNLITGATVVSLFLGFRSFFDLDNPTRAGFLLVLFMTLPLVFHRYSRQLWMAFDLVWDPPKEDDFVVRVRDREEIESRERAV